MSKRSNQAIKIALPVWVIVIIVAAAMLYQFFNPGTPQETQPITPTVVAQRPPTITSAPPSPSVVTQRPPTATAPANSASKFDFYMLSLSWSPDYCATNDSPDPQQCSIGKKLGFVLHGLWPQYNQGYPSDCSNVKLPASVKANYANLYPSQSLFDHEWEKHGTCSGLTPDQYLALSKRLKESVAIPSAYRTPEQPVRVTTTQFKKEFIAANPDLNDQMLAVDCSGSGRFLQEMYVCFSIEGKPTACSREIHNTASRSCQNADFLLRNVR
jgi:ribonuclease T2